MIRTVIVDQEENRGDELRSLVARDEELELVGDCTVGTDTLPTIRALDADLVILEVEPSGSRAFEVVRSASDLPNVRFVLVSPRQEHAVAAFDLDAVDFILRPIHSSRFERAMSRAKWRIRALGERQEPWNALAQQIREPEEIRSRLTVRTRGRTMFFSAGDVLWIESAGNYVRVHTTRGRPSMVRGQLRKIERHLHPRAFARINRSTIANMAKVREIRSRDGKECLVILEDGTELTMSRRFRDRVLAQVP